MCGVAVSESKYIYIFLIRIRLVGEVYMALGERLFPMLLALLDTHLTPFCKM